MANYCYYNMMIKGKKEGVDTLISYLQADYDYDRDYRLNSCSSHKHFSRVFECNVSETYDNYSYDDETESVAFVSGDCAWSVSSCMLKCKGSYYSDGKDKKEYRGTNMEDATKELNLVVEIFSEESGVGFMEHYIVRKGILELDECVDFEIDYDEDKEEEIIKGGIEWDFTI